MTKKPPPGTRATAAPDNALTDPGARNTSPADAASAPMPSHHLLQGRRAIEISHNGAVYRLQATKLGKLILTK
ncbi:MAG: hemin uptake protein HemP [Pseudomonadota bacterium]|nr:hemin uptake protein HemP [Pseudomonadota bacterium]